MVSLKIEMSSKKRAIIIWHEPFSIKSFYDRFMPYYIKKSRLVARPLNLHVINHKIENLGSLLKTAMLLILYMCAYSVQRAHRYILSLKLAIEF